MLLTFRAVALQRACLMVRHARHPECSNEATVMLESAGQDEQHSRLMCKSFILTLMRLEDGLQRAGHQQCSIHVKRH